MVGVFDCKVVKREQIGRVSVRTVLDCAQIAESALPGQFVNIKCDDSLDPFLRRPVSIHSIDKNLGTFSILVNKVGMGTDIITSKETGGLINVVGPLGNGFYIDSSKTARHILVAGGCGAAPLLFLADVLCEKYGPGNVDIITAARNEQDVLCSTDFADSGAKVHIVTEDGTKGKHGLATHALEELIYDAQTADIRVYACGPHNMLKAVKSVCYENNVAHCQVSLETFMSCGIGVCMGCVQMTNSNRQPLRVCTEGPVFDAYDLHW